MKKLNVSYLLFYGNRASRISLALGVVALIGSCQKGEVIQQRHQKTAEFTALLSKGRVIGRNEITANSDSLKLTGNSDPRQVSASYDDALKLTASIAFDTEKMEDVLFGDASKYCLAYVDAHFDDFKVKSSDLTAIGTETKSLPNKQIVLSFQRNFQGIPVRDSFLDCFFSASKPGSLRLRDIVNGAGGELVVDNLNAASIDSAGLTKAIELDGIEVVSKRDLIKRIDDNGVVRYTKVTEFLTDDAHADEKYTITAENGTNLVVEAFSNKMSADDKVFKASVYTKNYLSPSYEDYPLAFSTLITSTGSKELDSFGSASTADVNATISLTGTRGSIRDQTSALYYLPTSVLTSAADAINIIPNSSPDLTSLNTFANLQKVNHFVRRQLSSKLNPFLNLNLTVGVNYNAACNAFYMSGYSWIALFNAGSGCGNTALINDILFHEWGHALDDSMGRVPGITDGAFSEGVGDILAAYLTNNPKLAQGLYLDQDVEIRSAENTTHYPEAKGIEVHYEGTIISGAFWDLRVALMQRYGSQAGAYQAEYLFLNHLAITDSYLESYDNVLRIDDNDGNPATQSPNFCLINAAFATHGLATLVPDCKDARNDAAVPFNDKIGVAIGRDGSADAGKVMVALDAGVTRVQMCLGNWQQCVASDRSDVSLQSLGKSGDRQLFMTAVPFEVKEQAEITIISKDDYGTVNGVKTVKFVTR